MSEDIGIEKCPNCDAPGEDPGEIIPSLVDEVIPDGMPVYKTEEDLLVSCSLAPLEPGMHHVIVDMGPRRRPSFNEVWMRLAITMSDRSTCVRRRVGCVIVSTDNRRVLAVGYNGNAEGLPNECDAPSVKSGCGCIHAEENATISCVEPRSTPKVVYTTVFPCKMCAKRLVQLGGVVKVYFKEDYHNVDASKVFEVAGVETARLNDKWEEA
jgi:dCMP deaminase